MWGWSRQGAALFLGRHDFMQFANVASHSSRPRKTVKHMQRCDVISTPEGLRIEVTASGFLYRMVRHMVGCLIAIGRGQLSPEHISRMLAVGSSQPPGEPFKLANALLQKPQLFH